MATLITYQNGWDQFRITDSVTTDYVLYKKATFNIFYNYITASNVIVKIEHITNRDIFYSWFFPSSVLATNFINNIRHFV